LSVAVAVAGSPPTSAVGEITKLVSDGGLTVMVACRLTEPCVAVMVTLFAVTDCRFVKSVKLPLVAPAGMVNDDGLGVASIDELESATTTFDAAVPVSVTVPVADAPFRTEEGVIETAESSASANTSNACLVVPFKVAVMVTVVWVTPAVVEIANVALALPAAIVTDVGTVAATLFEESCTMRFVAAAPVSVTVPVAALPPMIVLGEIVSDASCAGITVNDCVAVF
jgi:hypothetical protein